MLIYLVFDIFSIDISSVFSNLSIDKSSVFSNLSVDISSVFSSLSVEIIQKCVYFNTYTIYANPIPQKRNTIQCSSSPSVFNSINIYILKSLLNSVTWSDRIWVNNEDLRGILEKGLRRSMLQGDNPRDWSKTLKQAMQRELLPRKGVGNAIFCAERLAITEVGRVQIEAQMMSYDVMGYDSLEVVTEPGACDICKPHDGEIVSVKDAQLGVNIPIFHPFCKCSTVAHMRRESLEKEFEKYENVAKNDDLGYNKNTALASPIFINKNDKLYEYAKKIEPLKNYEDVVCHADKYSFVFKDANGKESNVSAVEFAHIIKETPTYHGGNIRLISCEAGAKDGVVAQAVADELQVRVLAASDVVSVYSDGVMSIDNNGKWIEYLPRKEASREI